MATFTNEQLNLLLSRAGTELAYADNPGQRATTADTRILAPGYVLQVRDPSAPNALDIPQLSRDNHNNDQVRVDYWLNSDNGNLVVAYAGTYGNATDWRNNLNLAKEEYQKTTDAIVYLLNHQGTDIRSIDATGHSQGGAPAQYLAYDLALAKAEYLGTKPANAGTSTIYSQLNATGKAALQNLDLGYATADGLGGIAGVKAIFGGYDPSIGANVSVYNVAGRSGSVWDSVIQLGDGHVFGDGTMNYLPLVSGLDAPLTGFATIHEHEWFENQTINYLGLAKAAYPTVDLSGSQGTADIIARQIDALCSVIETQCGTAALSGGLFSSFVVSSTSEINDLATALNFSSPWGLIRDLAVLVATNTPAGRLAYTAFRIGQAVANETPQKIVPASWDWSTTKYLRIGDGEIIRYGENGLSTVYVTQAGDTAASIAARYGFTADAVATSSDISVNQSLAAGIVVTLPNAPVVGSSHDNPLIFDLSVNPVSLTPTDPNLIGSSAGGWGLLGSGAGFTFSMTTEFVNENGGVNVAPGFLATGGIRPGNHSLSEFGQLMNGLRAGAFNDGLATDPLLQAALSFQFATAYDHVAYIDPVTLDANNDGIRLSASPVNFDLNADGQPESLPWTAPTDPLLVLDLDGNGRIDNGTELVDLTDTGAPLNLFRLDDNGDQKLDATDAAWWSLELWADRNQDGYASAEERQSLADLGLLSIDLDPAHLQTGSVAGQNNVQGVIATTTNGAKRTMWDVSLQPSTTARATATSYAAGIDKITGSGQSALVAKSALGIALDLNGSGADQAVGGLGNDTLLGTANDDWLIGGAGADRFQGGAGRDLLVIDADDRSSDIDGGSELDTVLIADDRGVLLNLAQVHVEIVYGGYGNDVLIGGGADNYFIGGAAGDDLIVGGSADDVLSAEDGDDVVQGGQGDDLIRGHRGEDQLFGGEGNDVLDGGLDNDELYGEAGNDILVASGGNDTVDGGNGTDLLELRGELADYTFARTGDGSYTVTDKKNADGSAVAVGQVSDRNGVQLVKNVERFSFMRGQASTAVDFGLNNPLPVNDQISMSGTSSTVIASATLLANDLDFQSLGDPQLNIYWVGDAVGGVVALSTDKKSITFTPKAGYTGPMEFNYKVQDSQGNKAPIVTSTADAKLSGEMKGRVVLVPGNAPSDPDFAKQWYLGEVGAPQVWKAGYTGKGVKVLVLEPSGDFAVASEVADLNHDDLVVNKSASFQDTAVSELQADFATL